ncbi:hypothetical protein F2Q69_00016965 [Brassica cretica]|uniref:RNase H type-1 domain-containing protein n=1 Tax=Brassica cretica TaxID=69181 RepID=A0A8S9R0D2_BRACR|nr:hypothetical protein F2Q69_00016965 [Brassica cretica]
MAEALAIKEVLVTASHKSTPNVWIRFDSLELIRAINSNTFPMELYGILKDIESLSSAFVYFSPSQLNPETRSQPARDRRLDTARDNSLFPFVIRRSQLQLAFPITSRIARDTFQIYTTSSCSRINLNVQLAILISLVVHSTLLEVKVILKP